MINCLNWNLVSVLIFGWVILMFFEVSSEQVVEQQWDVIFVVVCVDQFDLVVFWEEYFVNFKCCCEILIGKQYYVLYFWGGDIDFIVGFVDDYIWGGGVVDIFSGVIFIVNIFIEEVWIVLYCEWVDGVVVSIKLFFYVGMLIDGIWIEFKDGCIMGVSVK